MEKKKMSYTFSLSIIGVLLFFLAFMILASGNSQLEPFFILFPYGSLALDVIQELWLIVLIMLLQYPFYGYLLENNPKRIKRLSLFIILIHITFVIYAFHSMETGFK